MKRTLTLFVNEFDNLVFGWKVGRNQYFLESDWTYSCSGKGIGIDLQEELKNLENDYDRVNKKFNIFRHDNDHYFYSDGNTDPWIIVSHFILEMFSKETGKDYRGRYLNKKRISLINEKGNLIPSNIKVDNMLLSDIIRVILNSEDHDQLKEFEFILDFCDDSNEMDELFSVETVTLKNVLDQFYKLSEDEQLEMVKKVIEEKYK